MRQGGETSNWKRGAAGAAQVESHRMGPRENRISKDGEAEAGEGLGGLVEREAHDAGVASLDAAHE
jgi:hypothetical protein